MVLPPYDHLVHDIANEASILVSAMLLGLILLELDCVTI